MKNFATKTVQFLVALASQERILAEAFFGINDPASDKPASRSALPILDEFIHGSSHFPALSIDDIIN